MSEPIPPQDIERQLVALLPTSPSRALLTRLRAAHPAGRGGASESKPTPIAFKLGAGPRLITGAAVVVFIAALMWLSFPARPTRSPASGADSATVLGGKSSPGAAAARVHPPIFLPVESARRLLSVHAAPTVHLPDEAPRRWMRAIFVDDLTAVGADTDAALHLRRAHEVYLPAASPIY